MGWRVTLRHPVTSAEEATNLLASLGPPFDGMRLERTPSVDGEETTFALSGQLTLPAGFDSFADSDLLAAVGGTPYADDLAAAGATPAGVDVGGPARRPAGRGRGDDGHATTTTAGWWRGRRRSTGRRRP